MGSTCSTGSNAKVIPLFQFFSNSKPLKELLLYSDLIAAVNIKQSSPHHYRVDSSQHMECMFWSSIDRSGSV